MKILGDYHTHTVYSDGKASVIEMVRAARERGLEEVAVSDHSMGKITQALRRKSFDKMCGEIESARSEMPVLIGIEANVVSTNGDIDVDENMRKKLDIVLLGVHVLVFYSFRSMFTFYLPNMLFRFFRFFPKYQVRYNTKVVKRAIEKNDIDIWTHPNKYFKLDVVEVAKTCAERGTLVELNGKSISFRPIDFERMAATGAKFIINSDAHSVKRVGDIARVEEFLKNCDFDPSNIINLNQTWTQYKKGELNEDDVPLRNQERDIEPETKRRGFFSRRG